MGRPEFQYTHTVEASEVDLFGHMQNTVYFVLFEEARWAIGALGGFGREHVPKRGEGPIVLEVVARFRKEVRLGERLTIRSRAASLRSKVLVLHQELRNEGGGLCCDAEVMLGLFRLETRKLISLTPDFKKAFGVLT